MHDLGKFPIQYCHKDFPFGSKGPRAFSGIVTSQQHQQKLKPIKMPTWREEMVMESLAEERLAADGFWWDRELPFFKSVAPLGSGDAHL